MQQNLISAPPPHPQQLRPASNWVMLCSSDSHLLCGDRAWKDEGRWCDGPIWFWKSGSGKYSPQNKTKQSKAKQSKAKLNKVKQSKAKQKHRPLKNCRQIKKKPTLGVTGKEEGGGSFAFKETNDPFQIPTQTQQVT